jgi:hypothetical protein
MQRSLPFLWTLAWILAVPAFLAGQDGPDRWNVQLELGFNGASGNSSFSILRTGAKATHLRTDIAEFETTVLVRYGKNEEKVIADDAKATVKLDLWPKSRWSPFLFAEGSRDEIRRLDARFSGGAGGKWTAWDSDAGSASVSAAALFDYQNFTVAAGSGGPETKKGARWSVRSKIEKKLSASASFEQVAFYQPLWDKGSDYVLDVTNSVNTQILGNLSLALEHQFLRDSSPPQGVEPDDQRFSVVLKVAF